MSSDSTDLELLSNLSGRLEIELAESKAEVIGAQLHAEIFEEEKRDFRDLTKEELGLVVFQEPCISLRGESGDVVKHEASNGKSFTVKELLAAVEETERRTRGNSEWFGGIDTHHIYFEGIHQGEDEAWKILWGS